MRSELVEPGEAHPARSAAFARDFLEFATRSNRGPAVGHAEYIVARKCA